uniref:Putative antiholin-like protein lrgb n=1 Tax=Rhipicephalus microplus TaxID=6941 RepID=A0A6M2DCD7_RHIMP
MSVASALRHAGATILALCIALIAAAHQFCKRRVATPGNGNVCTSVDDRRDLRYTLLDRANFAACLAAIIIFVIGIVCLLARAIDHMVRTRSSLDMGLVYLSMVLAGLVVVLVLCCVLHTIFSRRSCHPA